MKKGLDRFGAVVRRRWLVVFVVCVLGFTALPLIARYIPAYNANAELLVVSEALKDPTLSDPNLPAIIDSTEVLDRVIGRLNLPTDPVSLAKKIKTKLPGKSSIVDISYKDTDGDRAATVLNSVADEAVEYYHEIATRGYYDVISSLKKQIADEKKEVAAADQRLRLASSTDAVAGADNALTDLTIQFDALRTQRDQVAAALAADTAEASTLRNGLSALKSIARGEILQKDAVYQQVQLGYAKDVAALVSERSSFRDDFPGLASLADRTAREHDQVRAVEQTAVDQGAGLSSTFSKALVDAGSAEANSAADRARLNAIDDQLVTEERHLKFVAGAGSLVGSYRAQRDAIFGQYMALTQRLSTAEGDAAQAASLGTLVVVSRAIPPPSTLPLWLAALGFLVMAMAGAAAYLVDALNPRFWTVDEIESVYKRPIFAQVEAAR